MIFFVRLARRMECSKCIHKGRGTSVTHSAAPRVPSFCYYLILTSFVNYHETQARQHGIYWYLLITWQNESCTLLIGPCLWSITNILPFLSYKTNRFHVCVDHKRRQNVVITSETLSCTSGATSLFRTYFNVAFHLLLLNRRKATQTLVVNWHLNGDVITMHKLIRELVET